MYGLLFKKNFQHNLEHVYFVDFSKFIINIVFNFRNVYSIK